VLRGQLDEVLLGQLADRGVGRLGEGVDRTTITRDCPRSTNPDASASRVAV
jgi:hypothetical protein